MTDTVVSAELLKRLVLRDSRRTLRILARRQVADVFGDVQRRSGRMNLNIAARAGDRLAGWLLALYYRDGLFGFSKKAETAEYWRARTERRLLSDLEYAPDDKYAEMLAAYNQWRYLWRDCR